MANTLNEIAPDLYRAVEIVSREMVGFIPAVTINTGSKVAALGTDVVSFRTRQGTTSTIVPGHVAPNSNDQTLDTPTLTINQSKVYDFTFTDEEIQQIDQGDSHGFDVVLKNSMEQGFRTLANEIETDLASMMNAGACRSISGTFAGTQNLAEFSNASKILNENGAPQSNRCFVLGHAKAALIRSYPFLIKANESGGTQTQRQGYIPGLGGFDVYESQAVDTELAHTKGTLAGTPLLNGAHSKGATSLNVDGATGNRTVKAGDIVTISGVNYVVASGVTMSAGGSGTVVINAPGLREDVADNTAVALVNNHTKHIALHKAAAELAIRSPARTRKDNAQDVMQVSDSGSMLNFEVAYYTEYRQHRWEIATVWGRKVWQPEHIASIHST